MSQPEFAVFPVVTWSCAFFGEEDTEGRCHSPHVVSRLRTYGHVNTVGVSLNHSTDIVFVRLLPCKVTHFPPFYVVALRRESPYAAHTWRAGSYILRPQGVLSIRCLTVLHLLFYCHLLSYQYGISDTYFLLWVMIHYCFLKFCCPDCSSFGHLELFQWVLCPFGTPPPLCVLNFFRVYLFILRQRA